MAGTTTVAAARAAVTARPPRRVVSMVAPPLLGAEHLGCGERAVPLGGGVAGRVRLEAQLQGLGQGDRLLLGLAEVEDVRVDVGAVGERVDLRLAAGRRPVRDPEPRPELDALVVEVVLAELARVVEGEDG